MYDFSGLVCTALATLSYAIFDLFLLVAEKIVKKGKFKLKSRENITILFVAMALVVLSLLYLSRICWPMFQCIPENILMGIDLVEYRV